MFLMLFRLYSAQKSYFAEVQLVCDRRTNGPTDGPTDGQTHPYRDARTHLKTGWRRWQKSRRPKKKKQEGSKEEKREEKMAGKKRRESGEKGET